MLLMKDKLIGVPTPINPSFNTLIWMIVTPSRNTLSVSECIIVYVCLCTI